MSAGKIILLVFGVIVVLISFSLMAGGGALIWADATHVDSEGFIKSDAIHIERDSRAVVTGSIEIDEEALRVLNWMGVITVFEVEGRSNNPSKQIFIGVADESDVETYLNNVDYDEITFIDIDWLSFDEVTYTSHLGSSTPIAPTSQTFWAASAHGAGTQTMGWETEVGSHSIVLMNDDGSSGVDLSAIFKAKIPSIFGFGVGLLIGGIVLLIVGGFMVYLAVRRS
ncbi:hypothetical protein ES703_110404 [subsurface metagenome]